MKIKITESTNFNDPSLKRKHPIVEEGGKGEQRIWRFKNGFGASVVRFELKLIIHALKKLGKKIGSYGIDESLWELAVIKFVNDENYELDYNTGITEDVIGYLTEEKVEKYLEEIKKLKRSK